MKFSKNEFKMPEERFGGGDVQTEQPSHIGVILGVLVLLLMVILGGLYLWGTSMQNQQNLPVVDSTPQRPTAEENNEPESTNAETDVEIDAALSTSDELSAIQADIDSTRMDTLNKEIPAIEAEVLQ